MNFVQERTRLKSKHSTRKEPINFTIKDHLSTQQECNSVIYLFHFIYREICHFQANLTYHTVTVTPHFSFIGKLLLYSATSAMGRIYFFVRYNKIKMVIPNRLLILFRLMGLWTQIRSNILHLFHQI